MSSSTSAGAPRSCCRNSQGWNRMKSGTDSGRESRPGCRVWAGSGPDSLPPTGTTATGSCLRRRLRGQSWPVWKRIDGSFAAGFDQLRYSLAPPQERFEELIERIIIAVHPLRRELAKRFVDKLLREAAHAIQPGLE